MARRPAAPVPRGPAPGAAPGEARQSDARQSDARQPDARTTTTAPPDAGPSARAATSAGTAATGASGARSTTAGSSSSASSTARAPSTGSSAAGSSSARPSTAAAVPTAAARAAARASAAAASAAAERAAVGTATASRVAARAGAPAASAAPAAARPSRAGRAAPTGPAVREAWRARVRRRARALGPGRTAAVAAVLVLLVAGAGWALLAGPLTALEDVTASGTARTDPAAVVAALAPQEGTPLLRVDAGAVREALADQPFVADVDLVRHWPHGVEVVVTERVAVAAVPTSDGYALVDGDGATITTQPDAPGDLPLVQVDVATGEATVSAASRVARSLPEGLRAEVLAVTATTPDDVQLQLRGGAVVRWGSSEDGALKADVLALLRESTGDGATGYDVTAPRAPATW